MTARLHRIGAAAAFQPEGLNGMLSVRLAGTSANESMGVVFSTYRRGAHVDGSTR